MSVAARVWSEMLQDSDACERLERSWTASLRALYPEVGASEISSRFLEPWRQMVERQISLEQLEGTLHFGTADLPGWQSLGVAVSEWAGRTRHDPRDSGVLAREISQILLQVLSEGGGSEKPPLTLVRPLPRERDGATDVPESWTARGGLVGSSRCIRIVAEKCARVARDRYPVLLSGETGSGKELAARLLHDLSGDRGPFVPVNCAALPETLIECELFGHARGAFTGATAERDGLIKAAQNGTLFLDEISELPVPQQAKLLRVLQDGLVRCLGSTRYEQVDVRVVSATNRDMARLLSQGQLRRDLYYRLAVHEIRLPPLREHREDIPELVAFFLDRGRRTNPGLPPPSLTSEAIEILKSSEWPGNVRQLQNIVYRIVSTYPGEKVAAVELRAVLEEGVREGAGERRAEGGDVTLENVNREAVERALILSGGNKAGAARLLGITRKALYNKIRRYRISIAGESR